MIVTYAKTHKGLEEMESRSGGLSPRVRRLLIFIDGKRSVDQLKAMVGDATVDDTIELLQMGGYIEPVEGAATAAPSAGGGGDGYVPDQKHLEMARRLMLNSLNDFTGPLKYRALMQRIREATNEADLRALIDEWYQAVNDNPAASFSVDDVRENIIASLEGRV